MNVLVQCVWFSKLSFIVFLDDFNVCVSKLYNLFTDLVV